MVAGREGQVERDRSGMLKQSRECETEALFVCR